MGCFFEKRIYITSAFDVSIRDYIIPSMVVDMINRNFGIEHAI